MCVCVWGGGDFPKFLPRNPGVRGESHHHHDHKKKKARKLCDLLLPLIFDTPRTDGWTTVLLEKNPAVELYGSRSLQNAIFPVAVVVAAVAVVAAAAAAAAAVVVV